jgi:hypothetical protein
MYSFLCLANNFSQQHGSETTFQQPEFSLYYLPHHPYFFQYKLADVSYDIMSMFSSFYLRLFLVSRKGSKLDTLLQISFSYYLVA